MKQHYHWRSINTERSTYAPSCKLFDVWIEEDGSLHNPNNYPEDLVRVTVLRADAQTVARKLEATERAVATRRYRQQRRIHEAARRILADNGIGKQKRCFVCHKALTDTASIYRGIGPECWQHVLDAVAARTDAPQSTLH
jgi:hypothetical protein